MSVALVLETCPSCSKCSHNSGPVVSLKLKYPPVGKHLWCRRKPPSLQSLCAATLIAHSHVTIAKQQPKRRFLTKPRWYARNQKKYNSSRLDLLPLPLNVKKYLKEQRGKMLRRGIDRFTIKVANNERLYAKIGV